ncbi:MAG: hypothetical protein RIS94_1505 [Pseudomonadota bacterium]|jgi:hypothetical protein
MSHNRLIVSLATVSALALSLPTAAYAGKADRARQAIAAAQAKIDAATTTGAGVEVPHQLAEAKAALAHAQENLASHHKPEAIDDAIHTQALADAALGEVQKRKEASAMMQQQAAQEQAAQANARADAAQQSAQVSAQQAADARNAAATAALQAQSQPAAVETTVTTQAAAPAARTAHRTTVRKRVVRHATRVAPATAAVSTTTTVSTRP